MGYHSKISCESKYSRQAPFVQYSYASSLDAFDFKETILRVRFTLRIIIGQKEYRVIMGFTVSSFL